MKVFLLLAGVFGLSQAQALPLEAMSSNKVVQVDENITNKNFSSKEIKTVGDVHSQDRNGILEDIQKVVQGSNFYGLNGLYLSRNNDEYTKRTDLWPGITDNTLSVTGASKDQWYYRFVEKDLDINLEDPVIKKAFLETSSTVQVNFDYYFNLWNSKKKWTNSGGKHPSPIYQTDSFELTGKNTTHHLTKDHDASHAFNESVEFSVGEKWVDNHLHLSLVFGCWLHWDDKSKNDHTALVQVGGLSYSFSSGKYLPSLSEKLPSSIFLTTRGAGNWNVSLKGLFSSARKLAKNPNKVFNVVIFTQLAIGSIYSGGYNQVTLDVVFFFALFTAAIARDLTDIANGADYVDGTLKLVIDPDGWFWFEYDNPSSGRGLSSNTMYSDDVAVLNLAWRGFAAFAYLHYNIV